MTDESSTTESVVDESDVAEAAAAATPNSSTRGGFSLLPSLILATVWVVGDQLSKRWAVNELTDRNIDLVGSLRFNLHFNSGMAFGRGTGFGPVIGVVAIIVVVALLVSLRRSDSRMSAIAVGLVIGGALGNVLDRLFRGEGWFRGAVVDFIDLQWFPIFNVADIGINVGAGLLLLGALLTARRDKSAAKQLSQNAG
jgi:signal peptidase II